MGILQKNDSYNILLIEDNPIDRKLIHEFLEQSKLIDFELKETDHLSSGLQMLSEEPFDAILLDLFLPDAKKLEALDKIIDLKTDLPIIILTGLGDEDIGITAVRRGAQDFLEKGDFDGSLLIRSITYAIERKRAEKALRESEERFRKVFDEGPLGMTLVRPDKSFIGINKAFCEMVGYTEQELLNNTFLNITHPDDVERDSINVDKLLNGEITRYQTEKQYIKKNGDAFWSHTTVSLVCDDKNKPLHFIAMIEDIGQRKRAEEEMRKQLMKFNVVDGNIYLIKEKTPTLSHNVFTDLIKNGYRGLALSRTPEKEFKKNFNVEFEFLLFSESGRKKSITPHSERIEKVINNQLRKSVILIDRFDYLIIKNGFKETLKFVFRLNEITYLKNLVVILSVDPTILPKHNIRSLEKETKEIEPRILFRVPDEWLGILRFVYQQNSLGVKPSYTDIGNELELSKPTTRKRLNHLVATGYLNEQKSGNRKILELTEKGYFLFRKNGHLNQSI